MNNSEIIEYLLSFEPPHVCGECQPAEVVALIGKLPCPWDCECTCHWNVTTIEEA